MARVGHGRGRTGGRSKSARELSALLVEVVPVLVYFKMIYARAVKVCGQISDAFAAIARARGFEAYLVSMPGHFVSEVVTSDGVFEVDLSHVQFACRSDVDVRRALERVAENPFAAIRVRRVEGLSESARAPAPDVVEIGYEPVSAYPAWKAHTDAVRRGEWDPELDVQEMRVSKGLPYARGADAESALAPLGASAGRADRGSTLRAAIATWKGSATDMQIHIEDELSGAPVPPSATGRRYREQAQAILEELRRHARRSPGPLYRGSHRVPQGVEPWTSSLAVAERWARKNGGRVHVLPPDTPGIRVSDWWGADPEREWIVWT